MAYLICALAFGPPTSAAKTAHACRALRLNQPARKAATSFAEDLLGATLVETIARILEGLMTDRREAILATRPTVAVRTMPAITEGELRITQAGHTHSFAFRIRQREQRSPPVEKLTVLNTEIFAEAAALLAQRLHPNSPASAAPAPAGGSAPRKAGRPRKTKGAARSQLAAPSSSFGSTSYCSALPQAKARTDSRPHTPGRFGLNPTEDRGEKPSSASAAWNDENRASVSADAFAEGSQNDPPQDGQHRLVLD